MLHECGFFTTSIYLSKYLITKTATKGLSESIHSVKMLDKGISHIIGGTELNRARQLKISSLSTKWHAI